MSAIKNNFQNLLVGDEVRVIENKVDFLHYSPIQSIIEEDGIKQPSTFFRKNVGIVEEADWDKKKAEWSYFIKFVDKKTKKEILLWFLGSELVLV